MILAVREKPRPLPAAPVPLPRRETRQSAEMALFGIYEISKILNTPVRLETMLASVVNILTSFLSMRRGMIVVIDETGEPEIVATAGWAGEVKGRPIDSLPQAVIDRIVATQTSLVVQDTATDPLFAGTPAAHDPSRVSFIGVPIKDELKVIGTLSIDRVWDGSTDIRIDEDLRFLVMVANLVGQAVRLHRVVAADRKRLIDERARLEKALDEKPKPARIRIGGIVGDSPSVRRVMETISIVAPSNTTVLLRGESGTGKELFARAIHELSSRKAKPFIKLNCAAVSESVLESELFGHEKGAFTGAINQKPGRFELAHGGTLLLDEIGEISPAFQSKLLRVLQEGEFERVGGTRTLKVDVRLICATNRDLEAAVAKGDFRADLYYRINVVPVFLPPLRERPGDIALLARAFLDRFNRENGRKLTITDKALDLLGKCYFPGNVRELENCVRRTATLSRTDTIRREDFACAHGECLSSTLWTGAHHVTADEQIAALTRGEALAPSARAPLPPPRIVEPTPAPAASEPHVCEHHAGGDCPALGHRSGEKEKLIDAMERSGWVQAKAARILGLTPRQIGYALKKHQVELKRF